MKLTKSQWLDLDELSKLEGFKVLKEYIDSEKENVLKQIQSIKSYESISVDGVKVIHSADNQLYEIRGKLQAYDSVVKLIENSYKQSKKEKK